MAKGDVAVTFSTWLVWLKLAPGLPDFCARDTLAQLLGVTQGPLGVKQKHGLGVTCSS